MTTHPIDAALGNLPIFSGKNAYHYTNAQGLKGIVERRELWATDLAYMGDQLEYSHADHLIENELNRIFGAQKAEQLKAQIKADLRSPEVRIYATSLSESPDLTNQWLAYGDHGEGYQIEFDWQELAGLVEKVDPGNVGFRGKCARVEYDTQEQLDRVGKALTPIAEFAAVPKPSDPAGCQTALHLAKCKAITQLAVERSFLKSKSFEAERELRAMVVGCIATPTTPTAAAEDSRWCTRPIQCLENFRVSGSMLKPYFPIPLGERPPITRVTIGPNHCRPDLAKHAIQHLLWRHDLDAPVCCSRVVAAT